MSERQSAENGARRVCPECGGVVDGSTPYWADRETKQRHHDPCTTAPTLTDFLLARIAEDEAVVRSDSDWERPHQAGCGVTWNDHSDPHCTCDMRRRVLAECAAKRRIVEDIHRRGGGGSWDADGCEGCGRSGPCDDYRVEHVDQCPTLRALALPYADHPDFNSEWTP